MPSQVAAPILTEKMQTFVREYLIDLNATAAAIRTGYSKKTAHAIGWEMLRKPAVAAEVSRCRGELMNKLEVTAERVVAELASLAFSDIREIFSPDGALKPMMEWSAGAAAAVSSLEVDEIFAGSGENRVSIGQLKKLKLWSKVDALQLLARHLGLLRDRVELDLTVSHLIEKLAPDDKQLLLAACQALAGPQDRSGELIEAVAAGADGTGEEA